jgi:hypothetical protein
MSQNRSGVAVGFTYFAATMMILAGALDIFQGLAAVMKSQFFVVNPDYVYKLNATSWGWVHMALGLLILLSGAALLNGAVWARVIGVIEAVLVAVANFLWLPYQPVWSIVIIATCVLVVWALTAHGRDVTT